MYEDEIDPVDEIVEILEAVPDKRAAARLILRRAGSFLGRLGGRPKKAVSEEPEKAVSPVSPPPEKAVFASDASTVEKAVFTGGERGGSVSGSDPDPDPDPDPEIGSQTPYSPPTEKPLSRKAPRSTEPEGFAEFWALYPRKVGKLAAMKAYAKARPPRDKIAAALAWQTRQESWRKDGGAYVPHPATYLNQGRWEDEPPRGRIPTVAARAPVARPNAERPQSIAEIIAEKKRAWQSWQEAG